MTTMMKSHRVHHFDPAKLVEAQTTTDTNHMFHGDSLPQTLMFTESYKGSFISRE